MVEQTSKQRPKIIATPIADLKGNPIQWPPADTKGVSVKSGVTMSQNGKQKLHIMTPQELGNVMQNKAALYNNMTKYCKCNGLADSTAGGYHLPPFDDTSIDFLVDIFNGSREVLKAKDVGHIKVPRLAELSLKNIVD